MINISNKYLRRFLAVVWFMLSVIVLLFTSFFSCIGSALLDTTGIDYGDSFIRDLHQTKNEYLRLVTVARVIWHQKR